MRNRFKLLDNNLGKMRIINRAGRFYPPLFARWLQVNLQRQ